MTVFLIVFFYIAVMKRTEIIKNRVKTELEISMQNIDVKQQKFAEIFIPNIKSFSKLLLNGNVFPTFGFLLTHAKTTF